MLYIGSIAIYGHKNIQYIGWIKCCCTNIYTLLRYIRSLPIIRRFLDAEQIELLKCHYFFYLLGYVEKVM